jgi:hypothetical protein
MPSTTRRPRSRSTANAGRFGRHPAGGTPGRRPAVATRHGVAGGWLQRRRRPKQSALKRAMSGVSGALPKRAKKGASPARGGQRGKVGGLAVLAGAAGLIFKNRDKVASMARRDSAPTTPTPTHQ